MKKVRVIKITTFKAGQAKYIQYFSKSVTLYLKRVSMCYFHISNSLTIILYCHYKRNLKK